MIEERGRVVKLDSAFVWVETIRKDTCGSCEAKNGCGQGLMNRLRPSRNHAYIRAANRYPVNIGDEVTVALPESAVVSASFLVYLLPLLTLLCGAFIGTSLQCRGNCGDRPQSCRVAGWVWCCPLVEYSFRCSKALRTCCAALACAALLVGGFLIREASGRRSLSDLTLAYCEKAGFGHFLESLSSNRTTILLKCF